MPQHVTNSSHCWHAMMLLHQLTTPYNPQQNRVAERKNRMIMEVAKEMLHYQDLPMHLWEKGARTTMYVHNRTPHRVLENKTP